MFLTRVMPLKDANGRVVRWFGTNTDITGIKQAELQLTGQAQELVRRAEELAHSRQALEAQTLMLQSVLDSMGEGIDCGRPRRPFHDLERCREETDGP
jgi:hypothetical protein